MTLQLGIYNGDYRKVDKTQGIAWIDNEQFVEVANGSDFKHYEILLENVDTYFNYAKIGDYYYFVKPVPNGANNLKLFSFDIDYYFSFKDKLLDTECIIERSSSHSNAYLKDSEYVVSTKTETITKKFPNSINDDSIILMTVG